VLVKLIFLAKNNFVYNNPNNELFFQLHRKLFLIEYLLVEMVKDLENQMLVLVVLMLALVDVMLALVVAF